MIVLRQSRGLVGTVGAVLALMLWRLNQHPMEAYGDSAAQYIEHLARLRILGRIRDGLPGGPLDGLVALDGLYPPGLHLVELAWGSVFGHGAASVVFLGCVWWIGLCAAVGVLGHRLALNTPLKGTGIACFAAMALLPATQGAALRSYYDLPMSTCLWGALAVLAGTGRWRGLGAGALLIGATLIKWTAVPFGLVMLLGWMGMSDREGRKQGGLALGLLALWVGLFLWAGAQSLESMGGGTFQPPFGTEGVAYLSWIPGVGGRWLQAAAAQLGATDWARLAFYPTRLVTTVLAPVGVLCLAGASWSWWKRGRPGAVLIGAIIVGQLLFLLLLVPPLDERFLLTLAPALCLVAGLGLAHGGRWPVMAVAAMLMVAIDAHLPRPTEPLSLTHTTQRNAALEGRQVVLRAGISSSIDRRGWSRMSDQLSDRSGLRAALWARIQDCGGGGVHGPDALISPDGDLNWWSYRTLLGALESEQHPVQWLGEPGADPTARRLWLAPIPADAFGPPTDPPVGWIARAQVSDPEGGPSVGVFSPPGASPCS